MARSLYAPTPSTPRIKVVAPVDKGGTGGSDVVSAAQALGAVSQNSYGQPGGVAKSDGAGSIPTSQLPAATSFGPTLSGQSYIYPSQTFSYEITNFDSLTTYNISISAGTAVLSGVNINVTTPATAGGITLTVNGKEFALVVGAIKPSTPTIAVGLNGNPSAATASFTGSTFIEVGGSGTHQNTDWEIYTDPAMTNLAFQSQASAVNKTSWTQSGLALSTTYYARCRYRDNNANVSDWSNTLTFTTAATYQPLGIEEAIVSASDKASVDYFGVSVGISGDGLRVIIGAYGKNTNAGSAYVFVRSGSTWTQEQKLIASDPVTGDSFGYSVAISSDGVRIAVGAFIKAGTVTNQGAVYIYVRSGSTWTQEQKLIASDSTAGASFGVSLSITVDHTRVAIGAIAASNGSVTCGAVYVFIRNTSTNVWTQEAKLFATAGDQVANRSYGTCVAISSDGVRVAAGGPGSGGMTGGIYVHTRSGSTWTLEQKLAGSGISAGDYFGQSVAFSGDHSRLVAGSYKDGGPGAAYVFTRSGVTWTQEAKITSAAEALTGDNFGASCSMSSDGTRVVISSSGSDPSNVSNAGAVYVFTRSGAFWPLEKKITASNKATNYAFGYSLAMTPDSGRLVIGSLFAVVGGTSNAGAAYIVA